jgi:1-acyl-sn-glycerol-3-phosphate acyltransferase
MAMTGDAATDDLGGRFEPSFARRVSRWWRILGTAVVFAYFDFVCLLVGLVVMPIERLRSRDAETRERRVQRAIQRLLSSFCFVLQALRLGRITWIGEERLALPGRLVLSNHPSLIDAVLTIARMPHVVCVAKSDLWQNPVTGGAVRAAGYIPNHNGPQLVEACTETLSAGNSLLLFPEGTRSPRLALGPFQRGAAHVALRSGCEILPVVVTCDPPTLMKGQKWYDVPDRMFELTVRVCEPFRASDLVDASLPRPIAARQLTASLREYFEKELARSSRETSALPPRDRGSVAL